MTANKYLLLIEPVTIQQHNAWEKTATFRKQTQQMQPETSNHAFFYLECEVFVLPRLTPIPLYTALWTGIIKLNGPLRAKAQLNEGWTKDGRRQRSLRWKVSRLKQKYMNWGWKASFHLPPFLNHITLFPQSDFFRLLPSVFRKVVFRNDSSILPSRSFVR